MPKVGCGGSGHLLPPKWTSGDKQALGTNLLLCFWNFYSSFATNRGTKKPGMEAIAVETFGSFHQ